MYTLLLCLTWQIITEEIRKYCVFQNDPLLDFIETVDQVPPYILKEITHFFEIYKNLEGKSVTVIGWKSLKEAVNILNETKFRYLEQKK